MKTIRNLTTPRFNKHRLVTASILTLCVSAGSFSCVKRERTLPETQLEDSAKADTKKTDPAEVKKDPNLEEATDFMEPHDDRKDVLNEWTVAYKAAVRKLHPDIETCSDENPDDPAAPYECACKLICKTVFPRPPGGGIITVRYPLHGVRGFSIIIDKEGNATSCSYTRGGENAIDLNVVCRPKP